MKGSQKRWQPNNSDSVIATLMGFDELCCQPAIHEKRRVLSESYIHKVASIALRPGSLVSKRTNENVLDRCVNSSASNVRTSVRSSKPAGASVSKSLSGYSYEDRNSLRKKREYCATRHVLRRQQKLEHDSLAGHLGELGIDFVSNSLNFPLEMIDKPRLLSSSISGFKPMSEGVVHDLEDVKFDIHSRPGYREHGKSLMLESRKPHHLFTYKELVDNGIVSPRHSCIASTVTMNRIPPPERRRNKIEEVSKPGYQNVRHDSHVLLDPSSLANKSRKKNFERWKTAKKVQEFGVSGRKQTLNGMLALADSKSMARNLDMTFGRGGLCSSSSLQSRSSDSSYPSDFSSVHVADDDCPKHLSVFQFEVNKEILSNRWNLEQDERTASDNKSMVQTTSLKDILESKSGRDSEQFQISLGVDDTVTPSSKVSELSSCDFSCFGSSYNNTEAYILGIRDEIDNSSENERCNSESSISNLAAQYVNAASYACEEAFNEGDWSRINGDPQSNPGIFLEEGGVPSKVEEVFSKEASINEFSEEESAYSNCSGIGPPESLENLRRANQRSPDSVLELYDMKNPPPFECFDSIGLQLQLQALNFESEETCSEGSAIIVSGDEGSEEQFGDLSHDGRKVKRWLGDDESRNYSYMVDVLDEAGFYDMNSFMDFNTWASLECPISPLVFDTLEKKYGKQTSWQKLERQLLFDRINSGLLGNFNPVINFQADAASMRRKFRASFRRDEVEEELWMMLISQENEKSKDLSEKALDKWSELEEGISIICRELEASLFDDLVMELASLWN